MQLEMTSNGNTVVLNMSGRFDFNDHKQFKSTYDAALAQVDIKVVEVNLSGVSYLDSSALGMLMLLRERAEAAGKSVELSKPNATVAQILDIANFAKLFRIR